MQNARIPGLVLVAYGYLRAEEMLYKTTEENSESTKKKTPKKQEQSKRQCWKVLCSYVDRDPWSMPYRLVMRKLQTKQGSGATTDVPTVLKIVEALFPKGVPRSYPSDIALQVPQLQISELKLAAKRLESGMNF